MNRITRVAAACALAAAIPATIPAAWAQAWPARPVNLIVPFPAGGTTDVLARALGQELSKSLGQPVVVENRPGAGATLGADHVAKAKPDGYTLLMGAVHHTIATSVYRRLGYDFQKDLAPITVVAVVPNVLVVNPQVPAKTVQELLAQARAQPGKLAYGSNGAGTGQHLIGAQFESMGGVELLHVPYKGSGPLTTDLLGGQIAMSFDTVTPVLPHIKAGKLRALAVTSPVRVDALPDVPTAAEAGLKDFEVSSMFGIVAPANTPAPVIDRLNGELKKILAKPEVKASLLNQGAIATWTTPADASARVSAELARWTKVIDEAGVKGD